MAQCTPTIWNYGGTPKHISLQQAIAYAQAAGFSGQGLINAVAIAMSESGLNANSANSTTSCVGTDRGIVKFNSVFHADVPDSCAYDPACAFKQFYRVSSGGTNFCEWCTYTTQCGQAGCRADGGYSGNIAQVKAALAQPGVLQAGSATPGSTGVGTSTSTGDILGQVKVWGEYMAIFAIAIVLVLVGFFLLSGQSITKAVGVA